MLILAIMALGVVVGFFIFPDRKLKWCERGQLICTCLLIFSMGVLLGSRENFISELLAIGVKSLVLAIIPIAFSVAVVYFLTKRFFYKESNRR